MSYTAVEVFTASGDFADKGAIPRLALIFDMEGAPQITRQAQLGRRCRREIGIRDDRFRTRDTGSVLTL
jgi:hypothetical protein